MNRGIALMQAVWLLSFTISPGWAADAKPSRAAAEYDEWVKRFTIESRTAGFLQEPDATKEVQVPIKLVITVVYGDEGPAITRSQGVDTVYISVDGNVRFVNVNSEGTQVWWGSIPKKDQTRLDQLLSRLPDGDSRLPPRDRRVALQVIEGGRIRVRVHDRANAPDEVLEIFRFTRCYDGSNGMVVIEPWMPEFKLEGKVRLHDFAHCHQLALTPGGILLSVADNSPARLLDAVTHKFSKDIPVSFRLDPEEIRFSPDGSLAAFSGGCGCHVLDTKTWQVLAQFEESGVARSSPRFTADGRFLILHCYYNGRKASRLRAYDIQSGESRGISIGLPMGALDYVEARSGKRAVILLKDKTVALWDVARRRDYAKLAEHVESCKVAFSPDESIVAIATERQRDDGNWPFYRIRIWKTDAGKLEHELRPAGYTAVRTVEAVEGLQWTPDARFVFAATRWSSPDDYTVHIWGGRSGRLRGTLGTGLCRPLGGVVMLPDGRHVVVSGSDGDGIFVRFWDFGEVLKQVRIFEDSPSKP